MVVVLVAVDGLLGAYFHNGSTYGASGRQLRWHRGLPESAHTGKLWSLLIEGFLKHIWGVMVKALVLRQEYVGLHG